MEKATRWMGAVVVVALVMGAQIAQASNTYLFQDLGHLGGGSSQALGINENRQVVGKTRDGNLNLQSFLWTTDKGMSCLLNDSVARKVNNFGQMVGELYVSGHYQALFWTSPGSYQTLGTLGGQDSLAYAINDQGRIVGYSDVLANTYPYTRQHAFLWTEGAGMQDLGTLGGYHSIAYSLNNLTQVAGRAEVSGGNYHAFLWDESHGLQDLTLVGVLGINSVARDINNLGQVVGNFFYDPLNPQYYANAFLWSPTGGFVDLGNLGGYYCQANAINDRGIVVGHAVSSHWQHAFIWTPETGIKDLNDLVMGAHDPIVDVFDINNAGEIVGVTAGNHACLLVPLIPDPTPTPVPSSLVLLGSGLGGLLACRGVRHRKARN